MLKAKEQDIRFYGITVYRIFGKKKDLERQANQLERQMISIDLSEQSSRGLISFQNIESINTGILTEVWSYKEQYHYDSFQAGYKIITLKRGDILEFIGTHRIIHLMIKIRLKKKKLKHQRKKLEIKSKFHQQNINKLEATDYR